MSKIIGGLCTLFLIIVFTPILTRADPLVVTGGNIMISGIQGGPLGNLTGDNFRVGIGGSGTGSFAPQTCFPCLPGSTMGVTGFFGSAHMGGGSFNINGTTFTNVGLGGVLLLNGGTIVVPSVLSDVTITVPFTASANLNACPVDCFFGPTLFTVQLVGSGTATIELTFARLSGNGQPIFLFKQATFQFEEVPEPASILLFGGGFALLTAKLRRRLSSRNNGGI
jgi:hypothetical protein